MTDQSAHGVVVVGAGAFGRNHLRVYRDLERTGYPVRLLGLVDQDEATAQRASIDFGVPGFQTLKACVAACGYPHAASICVPTAQHRKAAEPLLRSGVHVLIEKPLASNLDDADHLLELAAEFRCILQVGHLERFNPAVSAAKPYLNRPMFFEAHRLSVFTPRSLDVDVVLDLMIHDLDVVLSFMSSSVREVRAVGLPVLSQKVDIANVRLEFENGCVANFTASRVSTERVRKLRFFQPQQYLSLDFARQDLLVIDVADNARSLAQEAQSLRVPDQMPGTFPSELSLVKVPVLGGEPLKLEIEAFLESIRTASDPLVSGLDGRRALALALQINEVIRAHAVRAGLSGS